MYKGIQVDMLLIRNQLLSVDYLYEFGFSHGEIGYSPLKYK